LLYIVYILYQQRFLY